MHIVFMVLKNAEHNSGVISPFKRPVRRIHQGVLSYQANTRSIFKMEIRYGWCRCCCYCCTYKRQVNRDTEFFPDVGNSFDKLFTVAWRV